LLSETSGAAYGDAMLVAEALGVRADFWNPTVRTIEPDPAHRDRYDAMFTDYLALYETTAPIVHRLSRSA